MEAIITASLLYLFASTLSCAGYYLHLRNSYSTIPRGRLLAFSLCYPASLVALSVIIGSVGVYYRLLPNSDTAFLIAACIAVFPAATATHYGTS